MDRLDAIALFLAAVDAGSLAASARRFGRSPAAVTRAVALLEQGAGETLLLRSTRKLSLTPAGDRHVAIWREVLAKLGELAAEEAGNPLQGEIVLTAPELFGRATVMPLVESFLRKHSLISARVLVLNRIVNLIGEGIDVAIRLAPMPDSTLTAVKVGTVRTMLCASPTYLAAAGAPTTLKDLEQHDCIGLNAESDGELWAFSTPTERGGRTRSVRVRTRLSVNSAAASIDAALRGGGLIRARSYQVAAHIKTGHLVRLLADHEAPPIPVHVVFPSERARKAAVRAFIDHIVPALRRELAAIEKSISED